MDLLRIKFVGHGDKQSRAAHGGKIRALPAKPTSYNSCSARTEPPRSRAWIKALTERRGRPPLPPILSGLSYGGNVRDTMVSS